MSFTSDMIKYRKGNLVAAVAFASVADGVSGYSKVEFLQEENTRIRGGEIVHGSVGGTTIVSTRVYGITIKTSHSASFMIKEPEVTCVVNCEENVRLFTGYDLTAELVSFKVTEMMSEYNVYLSLLVGAVESDTEGAANDMCSVLPVAGLVAGWYDGTALHLCDGTGTTVTDVELSWVTKGVQDGCLWHSMAFSKGVVGIKVSTVCKDNVQGLAPASDGVVGLSRDGVLVLGGGGDAKHQVELQVPGVGHGSAFWTVVVAPQHWTPLTPPPDHGCFTQDLCECEKDKLIEHYIEMINTHTQAAYNAVEDTVAGFVAVMKEKTDLATAKEVVEWGAEMAFVLDTDNSDYTGYVRMGGGAVNVLDAKERPILELLMERAEKGLLWNGTRGVVMSDGGVVVGVSASALATGLAKLVRATPVGGQMFLANEGEGLVAPYSDDALLQGLVADCKDTLFTSTSCIVGDDAYTITRTPAPLATIVTMTHRPSKQLSKDSTVVQSLFHRLQTDLATFGPAATSLYFVSSTGTTAGVWQRSEPSFGRYDPRSIEPVMMMASVKDNWIEASAEGFVVRKSVRRDGKLVGVLGAEYSLGDAFDNELKKYHGSGPLFVFNSEGSLLGTTLDNVSPGDASCTLASFNVPRERTTSFFTNPKMEGLYQSYAFSLDPVLLLIANKVNSPLPDNCISELDCSSVIGAATIRYLTSAVMSGVEKSILTMDSANAVFASLKWYTNSTEMGQALAKINKHKPEVLSMLSTRLTIYNLDMITVDVGGYSIGVQRAPPPLGELYIIDCSKYVDGGSKCAETALYNGSDIIEVRGLARSSKPLALTWSVTISLGSVLLNGESEGFKIAFYVPDVDIIIDPTGDRILKAKDSDLAEKVLTQMKADEYTSVTTSAEGSVEGYKYVFAPVTRDVTVYLVVITPAWSLPGKNISAAAAQAVPFLAAHLQANPHLHSMSFTYQNDEVRVMGGTYEVSSRGDVTEPGAGYGTPEGGLVPYCARRTAEPFGMVCGFRNMTVMVEEMGMIPAGYLMLTREGSVVKGGEGKGYEALASYAVHENKDTVYHEADGLYVTMDSTTYAPWVVRYANGSSMYPRHADDIARVTMEAVTMRVAEREAGNILSHKDFTDWGWARLMQNPSLMYIGSNKGMGFLRSHSGEVLFIGCANMNLEVCPERQLWHVDEKTGTPTNVAGEVPGLVTGPYACELNGSISRAFTSIVEEPAAPSVVCSVPPEEPTFVVRQADLGTVAVGGGEGWPTNAVLNQMINVVFGEEGVLDMGEKYVRYETVGDVVVCRVMDKAGDVVLDDVFLDLSEGTFADAGGAAGFEKELQSALGETGSMEGVAVGVDGASVYMGKMKLTVKITTSEGWEQDRQDIVGAVQGVFDGMKSSKWKLLTIGAQPVTAAPATPAPETTATPTPTNHNPSPSSSNGGRGTVAVIVIVVIAGLVLLAIVIVTQLRTPRMFRRQADYVEAGYPHPAAHDSPASEVDLVERDSGPGAL
eukprot:TRINITY_DN10706_c0_g2_i8.p1 TRINITY_DN10706_c0_g2~~TRINITY_DN10706_c0_g2_i8.p1  ORF type:complete len:1709 (+),score=486.85 TRINITY_DN10706_c0_g2_i8:649-5127(+)